MSDEVDVKSCIAWIPRGIPAEHPTVVIEEDIQNMSDKPVKRENAESKSQYADFEAEMRMDEYDDEPDAGQSFFNVTEEELKLIEKGDPNLKAEVESQEDEEEAAKEQLRIDPEKEFCLVLGTIEGGDHCSIDTYVYQVDEVTSYFHHTTVLDAFPLAVEAVPYWRTSTTKGFHVAVGSFNSEISIWDNDKVDSLTQDGQLAQHKGPVTALALNRAQPQLLLSVSHDKSAIIWDTSKARPLHHFEDLVDSKIQCCDWTHDGKGVICGAEDNSVVFVNLSTSAKHKLDFGEPVETICALACMPGVVLIGGRQGTIAAYKCASDQFKKLFDVTAVDGAVLSIAESLLPGLIVSAHEDGSSKVFDIREGSLRCVAEKEMKVGPLYCVKCCPDPEFASLVAFGGTELVIWDVQVENAVAANWNLQQTENTPQLSKNAKRKLERYKQEVE